MRKIILLVIGFALIVSTTVAAAADNQFTSIKKITSEMVTAGVEYIEWEAISPRAASKVSMVKIDLQHPYVELDTLYGRAGLTGNTQSVTNYAKESGAVAVINGDFFTLTAQGAPFGATISEGQLINSPAYIPSKNALLLDYNNQPLIERLDWDAFLYADNGASFRVFGINKTQYLGGYRIYGLESHIDRLHIYDENWNFNRWVGDSLLDKGGYVAAVITNDIVGSHYINQKPSFIPADSYVLLGHGLAADYISNNLSIGSSVRLNSKLYPEFPIKTAIEGSTLLVEDGKPAKITSNVKGYHARSAIGYSKDKRYLYLIAVEKSTYSTGMSLSELTEFLLAQKIDKAVNLDGGGSTALVTRPLGSFERVNQIIPANVYERGVPNAFGVFSTAPAGKLLSYELVMPQLLLVNEPAVISSVRMYDEYYNPIQPGAVTINWQLPANVSHSESFDAPLGQLLISQAGKYTVKSTINDITNIDYLRTIERDDIKAIEFVNGSGTPITGLLRLQAGESYQANIRVTFSDGSNRVVAPNLLDWRLTGVGGICDNSGRITINDPGDEMLVASYDGYSGSLPIFVAGGDGSEVKPVEKRTIKLVVGQKKATTATKEISLDQAPLIKDGRTYIPIRHVTELLGANVEWFSEERKVDITYKQNIYQLWINEATINVAGVRNTIDAKPFVTSGRTMVPVRALSESFGLYVDYNSKDRSITITER